MPRKKRRPQVPDLPPEQGFAWLARQQRRVATRNDNHLKSGYEDEDLIRLEELHAIAEAEAVAKFASRLSIPLAEFNLLVDEHGQYAGVEPV